MAWENSSSELNLVGTPARLAYRVWSFIFVYVVPRFGGVGLLSLDGFGTVPWFRINGLDFLGTSHCFVSLGFGPLVSSI